MLIPFNLEKTLGQYDQVVSKTKAIVLQKNDDYGQSWLLFRPFSMLEQAWIKIMRIRSIQEKGGVQKIVDEPITQDFLHVINYSVFGIMLTKEKLKEELTIDALSEKYDAVVDTVKELYKNKTHDYNEAWRDMAISTMVDIMLSKAVRGKTMHAKKTDTPEALFEIFRDILNYSIFCLIRIEEGTDSLL